MKAKIEVDKDNVNAVHLYNKYGFTEVLFDGKDEYGEYLKLMKYIMKVLKKMLTLLFLDLNLKKMINNLIIFCRSKTKNQFVIT